MELELEDVYESLGMVPRQYSAVHCRVRHPKAFDKEKYGGGMYVLECIFVEWKGLIGMGRFACAFSGWNSDLFFVVFVIPFLTLLSIVVPFNISTGPGTITVFLLQHFLSLLIPNQDFSIQFTVLVFMLFVLFF